MSPPAASSSKSSRDRAHGPGGVSRFLLLFLPPVTVLVVGFALLVVSSPRGFFYARLLGGPTEGAGPWTGRVQLVERIGEAELPGAGQPVRVVWQSDDQTSEWLGRTDEQGWIEVRLERPDGARGMTLSIYAGEFEVLAARGTIELSRAEWQRSAKRRSGVLEGRRTGPAQMRVAVARGVLAVPFPGDLDILVLDSGRPVRDGEVRWSAEGLDGAREGAVRTNGEGRARLRVVPREHVASLTLVADHDSIQSRWLSTLPVVPGALHGEWVDGHLQVQSAIERDSAWYTLVTDSERVGGGRIELAPADGGSAGSVPLPDVVRDVPVDELWAVLSSDPDGRSPSTVGWPLGNQGVTFDVVDALLLDGSSIGALRESKRRQRIRWTIGIYAGLATLLTIVLFVGRVRSEAALAAQLASPGSETETLLRGSRNGWRLLVGSLCVALGFAVVTLIGLLWAR